MVQDTELDNMRTDDVDPNNGHRPLEPNEPIASVSKGIIVSFPWTPLHLNSIEDAYV